MQALPQFFLILAIVALIVLLLVLLFKKLGGWTPQANAPSSDTTIASWLAGTGSVDAGAPHSVHGGCDAGSVSHTSVDCGGHH